MGGGSSTTTSNQNEQATTVPQTPQYAQDPVKNYYAGINNYQQADPYSFVTPTNALQQGAFNNASGLFQGGQLYGQAAQGAQNVMNATPTTYTAGFNGAQTGLLGNAAQASATGYQAPNMGQASTYNPTMAGNAAQATATGYTAPNLGSAAQANLGGYQAGILGNAAQAAGAGLNGTATQATSASLLDNLQAYQNPATQQLVDTTLSSMDDNAARVRAAQQAQFAKSGAFGGSRAGIAQAQTEADLARERGLGEANLRSQAWNAATGLSAQDAALRQATSLANMGAQNQRTETVAGLNAQNNQFNANAQNQYGLAQFGANNDAAQFGANAANTGALANQSAQNQFGLAQGQMAQEAAQFGANAQNQAGLANANAQNQFGLANQDAANSAGQFNADAQNQFASQQAGLLADAAQFGAGAQNQAGLANMAAQNQYGLSQFDAQNQANQFNAGQANQMGQFNAGAMNDAQQQQLARQLQASGLLGDIAGQYGQDYRADLGMQSDLGNSLWSLQNNYQNAPLTQLQNVGNMLNPGLLQATSGQTVTGTNSGVSQEKKSGGLFNSLLGVASAGAGIFSDRRLKRDIERLDEVSDGLGAYRYNYLWDEPDAEPRYGVMADEVAALRPWALGPTVGGYATVNMEAL